MDEVVSASQSVGLARSLERPSRDADLAECVAYARDRDPYGHRVHVIIATIGCGLLTLSTVTATIALFGLVGWSIARSWVLWPLWLRLLRHPLMVLVLAFFVWSALSLTWSTNVAEGAETLRAQRYLLLIPALVPVLGAVRWLLLGVLVGVVIQAVVQLGAVVSLGTIGLGVVSNRWALEAHRGHFGLGGCHVGHHFKSWSSTGSLGTGLGGGGWVGQFFHGGDPKRSARIRIYCMWRF